MANKIKYNLKNVHVAKMLTNDGELMNGLLHPAREVWKTYTAQVEGSFTKQ